MRKIIIAQYASLDGVVEAPEQWHFPYADENMFRTLGQVNSEIDTMLLGPSHVPGVRGVLRECARRRPGRG